MAGHVSFWTPADDAELDVLTHALAVGYFEHRKHCEACSPEPCPELEAWRKHKVECEACSGNQPLTFGPPCERYGTFVQHGATCVRCNPCPYLQQAIDEVIGWRDARVLLSRAQALRAEIEERAS